MNMFELLLVVSVEFVDDDDVNDNSHLEGLLIKQSYFSSNPSLHTLSVANLVNSYVFLHSLVIKLFILVTVFL
eukprot:m.94464 g.94464  ORF g.94464 m.94464 type:complete len:73 (+) comp8922_c0_seq22:3249-3467(+)